MSTDTLVEMSTLMKQFSNLLIRLAKVENTTIFEDEKGKTAEESAHEILMEFDHAVNSVYNHVEYIMIDLSKYHHKEPAFKAITQQSIVNCVKILSMLADVPTMIKSSLKSPAFKELQPDDSVYGADGISEKFQNRIEEGETLIEKVERKLDLFRTSAGTQGKASTTDDLMSPKQSTIDYDTRRKRYSTALQ